MAENEYQAKLIKRLYREFPDCEILKNDPQYKQGMQDLTLLFDGGFWATLEVKAFEGADQQPNQGYYVDKHDTMCFSSFIYPENEEAVILAIHEAREARGSALVS